MNNFIINGSDDFGMGQGKGMTLGQMKNCYADLLQATIPANVPGTQREFILSNKRQIETAYQEKINHIEENLVFKQLKAKKGL